MCATNAAPSGSLRRALALLALAGAASGAAVAPGVYGWPVWSGGGVVYDSDPEAEFQETVNKSKALRRAAEDAGLFARRNG